MEKATEAREKNEQGAELEQIKLCVVNSVASGLDGLVDTTTLKSELNGIVEEQGRLAIDDSKTSWEVIGKETKIKYEINKNGTVIVKSGITLTTTKIEFLGDVTNYTLEATLSNDLKGTINWSIPENNGVASISATEGNSIIVSKIGESGSTTITATLNGIGYPTTCDVEIVVPLQVGDSIDFGVDLLENETADWVILYDGTNDDATQKPLVSGKIFAILKDYLPNSKRISLGIGTSLLSDESKPYNVWNQTDNANVLKNKLNGTNGSWNALIASNITSKRTVNGNQVEVVGAIDSNTLIGIKGNLSYYLPSSVSSYDTNKCNGYWLATTDGNYMMYVVYYDGSRRSASPNGTGIGLCPVVILPSDIPLNKTNGKWQVDTTKMVDSN